MTGQGVEQRTVPLHRGLAARSITHQFDRVHGERLTVLKDVSLTVEPGHFLAVVGPSGCGKSTLLRMFAGLVTPSEGSVVYGQAPVDGPGPERAMVFQQDAVFPWQTVRGNIEYGPRAAGRPRTEAAALAEHWAEKVGLAPFLDAYPKELSGGMRKRVDLARAYAVDPDVLLMDEPFGALDAQTKAQMQVELLTLWERERTTVVFVTHDLEEAVFLADRVAVMCARPGVIVEVAPVDLPRPRTNAMRTGEQLQALRRRLGDLMVARGTT